MYILDNISYILSSQALLKTDLRTANVVAETDNLECLTLDRE